MAGQELMRDEVFALAGAFPVDSAKTRLTLARFPSWAVPETGYANAPEFWAKISGQLEAGVMPRRPGKDPASGTGLVPGHDRLAALAAAASAPPPPAPAVMPGTAGAAVSAAGGQGVQVGSSNTQINCVNYGVTPGRETPQAGLLAALPVSPARTALCVLVIGASPLDPDLPQVRADREAHAIERVAVPERIELKVVLGAEATDVQPVGTFRQDIVHFVCHGTADRLVFSDSGGESDYVAVARVARRLRSVVLAACDGERLAPFFAGVADTVTAHRGKLAGQCGVAFARQFHTLLNAPAGRTAPGHAAPGHAVTRLAVLDLAGIAREAVQYSAACDPVIASLIVLHDGG